MTDLNNSSNGQTNIDSKPLGGKSLAGILLKNKLEKPAKGLSRLISKETSSSLGSVEKNTSDFFPTDTMMNNEFLRIEREKNEKLETSLKSVMVLPDKMSSIEASLNHLHSAVQNAHLLEDKRNEEASIDLKHEVKKQFSNIIKDKKKTLYTIIITAMILGIGVGATLFGGKTKVVEIKTPVVKTVLAPKVFNKFVTTKYVNLRTTATSKAAKVLMISPNQTVFVNEKKGGWWKVSYKNLIQDKTYIGWVYFENLKNIK